MDKKLLAAAVFGAAAAAGAVTLGIVKAPETPTPATGEMTAEIPPAKEQCFGVAKAGENGCAAASHTCGGLSTVDNSGQEWMLVDGGSCVKMGGKLEAFDDPKSVEPEKKDGVTSGG